MGWVQDRIQCNLADVFEQLVRAAEADVSEANEFLANRSPKATFEAKREGSLMVVSRFPAGQTLTGESIRFRRSRKSIEVEGHDQSKFSLTCQWDSQTGSCSILIDGEYGSVSPSTITRKVLEPLFFPSGSPRDISPSDAS